MNCVKLASAAKQEVALITANATTTARTTRFLGIGNRICCIRSICPERSGDSMKKLKPIPTFKTEADERRFWETHDSTDYLDWSKAVRVRFPNLKPSTTAISIRLPVSLLEQIK